MYKVTRENKNNSPQTSLGEYAIEKTVLLPLPYLSSFM